MDTNGDGELVPRVIIMNTPHRKMKYAGKENHPRLFSGFNSFKFLFDQLQQFILPLRLGYLTILPELDLGLCLADINQAQRSRPPTRRFAFEEVSTEDVLATLDSLNPYEILWTLYGMYRSTYKSIVNTTSMGCFMGYIAERFVRWIDTPIPTA